MTNQTAQIIPLKKRKGLLISNTLIIISIFVITFYTRIVTSLTPLPSSLNHAHLLLVPLASVIVIAKARTKNFEQVDLTWMLIGGIFLFFTIITASTLVNDAGIINLVFLFLMLCEPFILLVAIIFLPFSPETLQRYRNWIVGSSFANMLLAFIQWPLINSGILDAQGLDATDGMGGVFFVSGAGNYVSTTISLYFALYLLFFRKNYPLWLRLATLSGAFFQLMLSDSKQVLLAFFIGWIFLVLSEIKDIKKILTYVISAILLISVFYWCMHNLEAFAAFKNYADKQGAYGPDGVATQIKLAPFRLIPTHYTSPLNLLFGLGPGHTVGRLGGWLLKENWSILGPLGATIHPVSGEMWTETYNNWIAMESTMFSPFFGWAGIWGDLGLAGLAA